jgi:hypothetical protein
MIMKKTKKLNNMAKVEYYVGILPEDREKFEEYVDYLNDDAHCDWKFKVEILNEFDDPNGYYTFQIQGHWDSYMKFAQLAPGSFMKSLAHYEE